ncbi:MAG: methyltransferase family protein [Hyphomicrobium sp.]
MTAEPSHHANDPAAERANTFPWPPVLFALVIAAAWVLGRWGPIDWPGLDDAPAQFVGIFFGTAGVALVAWAIVTLRRHDTTVMPDGTSTALVTSGPYRRFRNPIYLGEALMLLAAAEITKNVWFVAAAAAFAVLVTWLQILPEERHLQTRFGDAYAAYKAATRRWL